MVNPDYGFKLTPAALNVSRVIFNRYLPGYGAGRPGGEQPVRHSGSSGYGIPYRHRHFPVPWNTPAKP